MPASPKAQHEGAALVADAADRGDVVGADSGRAGSMLLVVDA